MRHPPTSSLYHTTTTNNSPPAFITLPPKTTSTALYQWPSTGSLTGPPLSIISPLCRPLHSASATQRQCIRARCKQSLTATALYAHSLAMNGVPGCGAPSVGTSAGLASRCGKTYGTHNRITCAPWLHLPAFLSPGRVQVALAGGDGRLRLVDVNSDTVTLGTALCTDALMSVTYSPSGKHLAVSSKKGRL